MIKVLHLIHSFNPGGIENWLISMLREIPRNQCEMDFCCKGTATGPLASIAQNLGAKIFHCPLGPAHFGFAQRLKRLLIDGQYQLLHDHSETYSGFPVWVAKQLRIPTISSFHNTKLDPQTSLTRLPLLREMRSIYRTLSINYALGHSNLVTGCSQGVLKSIDPQGTKIKNPPRVLYLGVNLSKPATLEERAVFRHSFGWSAKTPIVLHVGRLIAQKNHLGILSIFQMALKHSPTAKLLLVGDGPLRSVIEDEINNRGMSESVLLLGLRDDVPSLMRRCDVFLFPSIYEGFGLVAIEANAAHLPVVGSRVPGLVEAIRDGETGLLHDVKDIAGMTQSLVKLLSDRAYNQQLGQAGYTWVKNRFSIHESASHLLETYSSFA